MRTDEPRIVPTGSILISSSIPRTIYDSKGLEFDDVRRGLTILCSDRFLRGDPFPQVLLYNPFEDSTVGYDEWSMLLNEVAGQRAPQFDGARFSGICREVPDSRLLSMLQGLV